MMDTIEIPDWWMKYYRRPDIVTDD
jgi:hypothetical protein